MKFRGWLLFFDCGSGKAIQFQQNRVVIHFATHACCSIRAKSTSENMGIASTIKKKNNTKNGSEK